VGVIQLSHSGDSGRYVNRQAPLHRQAKSAAVVQRLCMGVKRESYEPSAAKQWQNLKYWVSRFGDGRLNPNSLPSHPNRS